MGPCTHGRMQQTLSFAVTGWVSMALPAATTLPADAWGADFLRYWVEALAERGMRTSSAGPPGFVSSRLRLRSFSWLSLLFFLSCLLNR